MGSTWFFLVAYNNCYLQFGDNIRNVVIRLLKLCSYANSIYTNPVICQSLCQYMTLMTWRCQHLHVVFSQLRHKRNCHLYFFLLPAEVFVVLIGILHARKLLKRVSFWPPNCGTLLFWSKNEDFYYKIS